MDEFVELILIAVIAIIGILLALLASFIENVFFTLRIKFFNYNEQKNIEKFLQKYHFEYTIWHKFKEIRLNIGLLAVITNIIKYLNKSRFFNGNDIIENAYFQIIYEPNSIKITNKITNNSIVSINNKNKIWELIIDNISEFFDNNQLINMLENKNYITNKQAEILNTYKISKRYNDSKYNNLPNNYIRNRRKILDINNCTIEQLHVLPGITLIIAKKLIKYRNDNKGFKSVADFWLHSGLKTRQRILIERNVIIKAKKVKVKYFQKLKNIIQRNIERIIDL